MSNEPDHGRHILPMAQYVQVEDRILSPNKDWVNKLVVNPNTTQAKCKNCGQITEQSWFTLQTHAPKNVTEMIERIFFICINCGEYKVTKIG